MKKSIGASAADTGLLIIKAEPSDNVIALAGNPNVGKSTLFNNLTGMKQHTGNWPGKTVVNAQGSRSFHGENYIFVDLPGTYSLMANSKEEEAARDFICFGNSDAVIVVCDATCLERNLNLVLQTIEITSNVIVCVNMMDEARKKNIYINLDKLSEKLCVPVIGTVGRKKSSISVLMQKVDNIKNTVKKTTQVIKYSEPVEKAIEMLEPAIRAKATGINPRWLCLKLLEHNDELLGAIKSHTGIDFDNDSDMKEKQKQVNEYLLLHGIDRSRLNDIIVSKINETSESICSDTVRYDKSSYRKYDSKADKILTSKLTGFPIMFALLVLIFWLTIIGANYPSKLISDVLFGLENLLTELFIRINAPNWLCGVLVQGSYRVLAWVVSVMLPPMAIFFPLFTLMEDSGYLPRIAFNLDKYFKKCHACGKQALTM
ncbi:MAG: ferrous iron transporter B [Eubacteriales bacterium]|nr:ferrous iron transporter B [Eubacteriales bacterium]